jgi:hypothetical protein
MSGLDPVHWTAAGAFPRRTGFLSARPGCGWPRRRLSLARARAKRAEDPADGIVTQAAVAQLLCRAMGGDRSLGQLEGALPVWFEVVLVPSHRDPVVRDRHTFCAGNVAGHLPA